MNFLIILAAVLMVHQGEWIHYFQRDSWFDHWLRNISAVARQPMWLPILLIAGIPSAAIGLLLLFFGDYWWVALLVNAFVVFFAIGRDSWRNECNSWVVFFAERDPNVLRQKLTENDELSESVSDGDIESVWLNARSNVLSHQLQGFYTVVFWFFLVGAPAALFYRLLQMYQQHELVARGQLPMMDFWVWLIEWIPVRLMGLLFCVVGNFTTGFWVLRQICVDGVLTSGQALARCADAALFLDGSVDDDLIDDEIEETKKSRTSKMIERMESRALQQKTLSMMRRNSVELQALLERSEWAFLVMLALISLI